MGKVSAFRLEFTLLQQSPMMIKKDQFDTVRYKPVYGILYSELVPALNRFLTGKDVREGIKHISGSSGHRAYDVRLSLTFPDPNDGYFTYERKDRNKEPVEHFGGYFGYIFNGEIRCSITSPDKLLIRHLDSLFPEFILEYGFGGKKSKGFGQFLETGTNADGIKLFLDAKNVDYYIKSKSDHSVFPVRDGLEAGVRYNPKFLSDYKIIKSGLNLYVRDKLDIYEKSRLRFAVYPQYIWEKKAIKLALKRFINPQSGLSWFDELKVETGRRTHRPDKSDPDERSVPATISFIRPLLGLPGHFEFLKQSGGNKDKIVVNVQSSNGVEAGKTGDIERYPSQVRFKVFNNIVYVLIPRSAGHGAVQPIRNKPFRFFASNGKEKNRLLIEEIRTPDYSDVDLAKIAELFTKPDWEAYGTIG